MDAGVVVGVLNGTLRRDGKKKKKKNEKEKKKGGMCVLGLGLKKLHKLWPMRGFLVIARHFH